MKTDLYAAETLILRGLFAAGLLTCLFVLGAMLGIRPAPVTLASTELGATLLHAPSACVLPPDGVVCPRQSG